MNLFYYNYYSNINRKCFRFFRRRAIFFFSNEIILFLPKIDYLPFDLKLYHIHTYI